MSSAGSLALRRGSRPGPRYRQPRRHAGSSSAAVPSPHCARGGGAHGGAQTLRRRAACTVGAVAALSPLYCIQQYYTLRQSYRPIARPPCEHKVSGLDDAGATRTIPDTYYNEGETMQPEPEPEPEPEGGGAGAVTGGTVPVPGSGNRGTTRLIIIGDSLVCGIGSGQGAVTLCAQVAEEISREKGTRVLWSSFGLDGGSAKGIGTMVPAIRNCGALSRDTQGDGMETVSSLRNV